MFIELNGATRTYDDEYHMTEKVSVNVNRIDAYYDHKVLIDGYKIRVMETYEQITQKLKEVGAW